MPYIDTVQQNPSCFTTGLFSHDCLGEQLWVKENQTFLCSPLLAELPRDCTGQPHKTSRARTASWMQLEVWLTRAALQGTLPVLDEWAAATVQTNPPCPWEGCCTRVPIPVWRLQALKYPLVINNLPADEETARVFAFFYVLAVQSPTSHSAVYFLSQCVVHADAGYFGSQAKAWSQTA